MYFSYMAPLVRVQWVSCRLMIHNTVEYLYFSSFELASIPIGCGPGVTDLTKEANPRASPGVSAGADISVIAGGMGAQSRDYKRKGRTISDHQLPT